MSSDSAIILPFSFNSSGGISYTTDIRKIWQDRVTLVVMSLVGERVMRPNFGTNTRGADFENTSNALSLIQSEIAAGFSTWLPNLTLLEVTGAVDPVDNSLNINVSYQYGLGTTDSVVLRNAILDSTGSILSEAPING